LPQKGSSSARRWPTTEPTGKAALIIGQATAVLATAIAVVYAAGGLTLGLRLWYDQFPSEPILGQLPRNLLVVNAVTVVAPAVIIGLFAYPLRENLKDPANLLHKIFKGYRGRLSSRRGAPWWVSAVAAGILAAAPLALLPIFRSNIKHGIVRPYWEIYLACLVLNFVFIRLALYLLPNTKIKGLEAFLGVTVLAFAAIPVAASATAAIIRFPDVALCGPAFINHPVALQSGTVVPGTDNRYAAGNLIGTSGQWVYVSVTIPGPSNSIIGTYIAVIPLSEVQLEAIGSDGGCGDLQPPTGPSPQATH
jgi:hypothetical protein